MTKVEVKHRYDGGSEKMKAEGEKRIKEFHDFAEAVIAEAAMMSVEMEDEDEALDDKLLTGYSAVYSIKERVRVLLCPDL